MALMSKTIKQQEDLSIWNYRYKVVLNVVVKDIVIGAGGMGFDSRAGQTQHCRPRLRPLRRFFGAVLPRR